MGLTECNGLSKNFCSLLLLFTIHIAPSKRRKFLFFLFLFFQLSEIVVYCITDIMMACHVLLYGYYDGLSCTVIWIFWWSVMYYYTDIMNVCHVLLYGYYDGLSCTVIVIRILWTSVMHCNCDTDLRFVADCEQSTIP